jgi:pyridoxamine 5'-phosphate oxidase
MADDQHELYKAAIERFTGLFQQAQSSEPGETTAMILATADAEGRPAARTVLLKGHDERGFVFYTNLGSRKGRDLAANPHCALLFLWQSLGRQVRIEGQAQQVTDEEADTYWAQRPHESQLGAWASQQSAPMNERADYERQLEAYRGHFDGVEIPRPPFWSGFRVVPDRIEFWHERRYRQHDRELIWFDGSRWQWTLLQP